MKVIEFRGGLGNQLFEYAHYLYLRNKYPQERFYGYYPSRELWCHQGLEIQKRFEVELPKPSRFTDLLSWILFTFLRKGLFISLAHRIGLVSTDTFENDSAFLQEGYWQDRKYISEEFKYSYKDNCLNDKTQDLKTELNLSKEIPVSVHIRRGDYLTCDCPQDFAGICTPQYYDMAIRYIKTNFDNPHFYFFSDDPEFVRENFFLSNMTVIDWNNGNESWQDMYLMSQCKAMILANSTFSFWAAQNNRLNPLVLCPKCWNNKTNPDLSMPKWMEIPSK